MIAFTSDIDWAPDEVIYDMLQIFEAYNVRCTLFCTHESRVLQDCNRDLFEIAVHPNFNPLLFDATVNSDAETVLDNILNIYPEAKGVRSHSMTQSTPLLNLFKRKGLLYDSNQFFPYNWTVKPYGCWTGLKRIPYNWEDDIHFSYERSFDYSILDEYSSDKTIIMDFHPIHVFLNTESNETYQLAKKYYHQPTELSLMRNDDASGARDFLIKTLKEIKDKKIKTFKLIDV